MAIANKKLATAVSASITGPLLTLAFANGEGLTVDANALSPEIQQAAMMHGLKQKLIDAAAISRDPETGRTATVADKYNAVKEVFDRITAAEGSTWNKARGNGEPSGNKGGLLVRAMMRVTSKSRDAILAYLDGCTKEQVAALRKNPRIMEIIAQLQIEQANTSGIDSDSLLDSLMDGHDLAGADDGDDEEAGEDAEGNTIDTESDPAAVALTAKAPKAKRGANASA